MRYSLDSKKHNHLLLGVGDFVETCGGFRGVITSSHSSRIWVKAPNGDENGPICPRNVSIDSSSAAAVAGYKAGDVVYINRPHNAGAAKGVVAQAQPLADYIAVDVSGVLMFVDPELVRRDE